MKAMKRRFQSDGIVRFLLSCHQIHRYRFEMLTQFGSRGARAGRALILNRFVHDAFLLPLGGDPQDGQNPFHLFRPFQYFVEVFQVVDLDLEATVRPFAVGFRLDAGDVALTARDGRAQPRQDSRSIDRLDGESHAE